MRIGFDRVPALFVRLRGRNDCVREYKALVSPATEYCIVPKVDAYRLGYPEAARGNPITQPTNLFRGVTFDGFWEGSLISMKEIAVGSVSTPNVDFIAYDIPQIAGFDVILGRSFLAPSRVVIDYEVKAVRIGHEGGSV
jgi:hypothetical protein